MFSGEESALLSEAENTRKEEEKDQSHYHDQGNYHLLAETSDHLQPALIN